MTKAEYINKYGIEQYKEHLISCNIRNKDRYKNDLEYREYKKDYMKDIHTDASKYRIYQKEYQRNELNCNGKTKRSVRCKSNHILFKQRHHTKLKDYQIHHCFGYEDPSKFIYIPKSLHNKIHQYLRDNNIDADSNHYEYIKYMINDCEEYTYISV